MNLCHLIGKPLDTPIRISEDFPEIEQRMEIQISDISARPEYVLLDKQEDMARQQIKLNRSELMPKVGLQGAFNYLHGFELNDETFFKDGSFPSC